MNSIEIFQMALQLSEPWFVLGINFKEEKNGHKSLCIEIDFKKGYSFKEGSVYDTHERTLIQVKTKNVKRPIS